MAQIYRRYLHIQNGGKIKMQPVPNKTRFWRKPDNATIPEPEPQTPMYGVYFEDITTALYDIRQYLEVLAYVAEQKHLKENPPKEEATEHQKIEEAVKEILEKQNKKK